MPLYILPHQIGAELVRQFRERVPTQKIHFIIIDLLLSEKDVVENHLKSKD